MKIDRKDFSVLLGWDHDYECWDASFLYTQENGHFDWYYNWEDCKLKDLYFTSEDDDYFDDLREDMHNHIIPEEYSELCENLYEIPDYKFEDLDRLKKDLVDAGFGEVEVDID